MHINCRRTSNCWCYRQRKDRCCKHYNDYYIFNHCTISKRKRSVL